MYCCHCLLVTGYSSTHSAGICNTLECERCVVFSHGNWKSTPKPSGPSISIPLVVKLNTPPGTRIIPGGCWSGAAVGVCGCSATVCAATHVLLRSASGVAVSAAIEDKNAEEGAALLLPTQTQANPAASAATETSKSAAVVFAAMIVPE